MGPGDTRTSSVHVQDRLTLFRASPFELSETASPAVVQFTEGEVVVVAITQPRRTEVVVSTIWAARVRGAPR